MVKGTVHLASFYSACPVKLRSELPATRFSGPPWFLPALEKEQGNAMMVHWHPARLRDLAFTGWSPKAPGEAVAQVANGNTLALEKWHSQLVVGFPRLVWLIAFRCVLHFPTHTFPLDEPFRGVFAVSRNLTRVNKYIFNYCCNKGNLKDNIDIYHVAAGGY